MTSRELLEELDYMLEHLISNEGMSIEEAADFVSYDTIRSLSYRGENAPIVMFGLQ